MEQDTPDWNEAADEELRLFMKSLRLGLVLECMARMPLGHGLEGMAGMQDIMPRLDAQRTATPPDSICD